MRVAVLGAGPIGLEAAAAAGRAGLEAFVLEATGRAGGGAAQWPHVRWYTPWRDNTTALGREMIAFQGDLDACPTGAELVYDYLQPLARWLDVRTAHRVLGVALWDLVKPELGFRMLVSTPSGETWMAADAVLDCTGCTYPLPTGPAGLPAPDESLLLARGKLHHGPVSVSAFAGRRVLLVGDSLDASRVARDLDALTPRPVISWIGSRTPGDFSPADDALPERASLRAVATEVAKRADRWSRAWVDRYRVADDGRVEVRVSTGDTLFVDEVIACCGFGAGPMPGPLAAGDADPTRGSGGRWQALGARRSAGQSDFMLRDALTTLDEVIGALVADR
jgi:hypothetical protein